jgi:N-succinyldiaminopimelate aminotransferase
MNPNLTRLAPYPFERLRLLLADAKPAAGLNGISLAIGEPRHAPPQFALDAFTKNLATLGTYPPTAGLPELRRAIATWLSRRFELPANAVDPDTMVIPVSGTREALFSFVQAAVDPTPKPIVVMPNPFYQIYEGAALLAGAEIHYMNADESNAFVPDLDAVPTSVWTHCQVLFLCTPGNPTGAVMGKAYLQRALELAQQYDFVVASDECYSEIYLDEDQPPPGLLQAAHAMGNSRFERCIVFHSLSKRSSVPGLRSGFVAGDAAVLKQYLLYRTYHGAALPLYTQQASIALWNDDNHVVENRALYRQKFVGVVTILKEALDVRTPPAGFYLWPLVGDDERFTRGLFEQQHVNVVPGSYLARNTPSGNPGRDRIRISLVATVDECVTAARRIRDFIKAR